MIRVSRAVPAPALLLPLLCGCVSPTRTGTEPAASTVGLAEAIRLLGTPVVVHHPPSHAERVRHYDQKEKDREEPRLGFRAFPPLPDLPNNPGVQDDPGIHAVPEGGDDLFGATADAPHDRRKRRREFRAALWGDVRIRVGSDLDPHRNRTALAAALDGCCFRDSNGIWRFLPAGADPVPPGTTAATIHVADTDRAREVAAHLKSLPATPQVFESVGADAFIEALQQDSSRVNGRWIDAAWPSFPDRSVTCGLGGGNLWQAWQCAAAAIGVEVRILPDGMIRIAEHSAPAWRTLKDFPPKQKALDALIPEALFRDADPHDVANWVIEVLREPDRRRPCPPCELNIIVDLDEGPAGATPTGVNMRLRRTQARRVLDVVINVSRLEPQYRPPPPGGDWPDDADPALVLRSWQPTPR